MAPATYKTLRELLPGCVAMWVASVLLGVAYNSASPLGVRATRTGVIVSAGSLAPAAPAAGAQVPRAAYANETVAMGFEGARPRALPDGPYANQTLSAGLDPSQPANPAPVPEADFPVLAWPEVKGLLKDPRNLLVDARMKAHFDAGHIPGAVSVPANSGDPELAAFAGKYARTTPLVIYCGSPSCPMAHGLARILGSQFGFSNIRLMPGGFAEYRVAESNPNAGGRP